MKKLLFLMAVLLPAVSWACPMADVLVNRYGISFMGFRVTIPNSAGPALPESQLLQIPLASNALVSDGLYHTAFVDEASGRAWILREGGFIPIHQWFGPVDVSEVSVEGCTLAQPESGDSAVHLPPLPTLSR